MKNKAATFVHPRFETWLKFGDYVEEAGKLCNYEYKALENHRFYNPVKIGILRHSGVWTYCRSSFAVVLAIKYYSWLNCDSQGFLSLNLLIDTGVSTQQRLLYTNGAHRKVTNQYSLDT